MSVRQLRRFTDEPDPTKAAFVFLYRVRQDRRKTGKRCRIGAMAEFGSLNSRMHLVGRPTSIALSSRVFRTFRISFREKNIVNLGGLDPTEDSSDEKDGSFDARNLGTSKCCIDLVFCRWRGSDTPVLTGPLRQQVSPKPRNAKL
jgi:hypothetical protein